MAKVHIFRAGTHTGSAGTSHSISSEDLETIAVNYNAAGFEAPITAGHPEHNTSYPALGWVKSLTAEKGNLYADVNFCDGVENALRKGFYKNVSAGFALPKFNKNNKEAFRLRHVAILGAQVPALKDLEPIEFAEGDDIEFFNFGEAEQNSALNVLGNAVRRIREWIIEEKGIKKADEIIPHYMADDIKDLANRDTTDSASYAEADLPLSETISGNSPQPSDEDNMTDTHTPEALDARARELEIREKQIRATEQANITQGNADFCEALVRKGKLLPKDKDNTIKILNAVSGVENVDFAEGESANTLFKSFLTSLNAKVDFAEYTQDAITPSPKDGAKTDVDFAAAAEEVTLYINAEAKKGRTLNAMQAMDEIEKQRKDS